MLAASMLCCTTAAVKAGNDFVVPPGKPVAKLSQVEWSRDWWQWAASFDRDESPITDETGELCHLKQSGPVWFLAGTYGTKRTIRMCKVPKDKYLFFPLINYVVTRPLDRDVSCATVIRDAAMWTRHVSSLILELDGHRVENLEAYRQVTKCFNIAERMTPKQFIFPAAANGYYVMLKPLPPGTHVLNFGGALPSMLQAVTYTLEVE
jgi:hypothetical protein